MGGEAVSVRVLARIRPINKNEEKKGEKSVVIFKGENGVTTESHPKKCFNFDAVLQPEVTQKEVFDEGMKPIVEHVLKGYNATIFAYGQTASGKTFTMEGALNDQKNKGVIPRMVDALFSSVDSAKEKTELCIKLSYFEIYNEKLQDLLKPENDNLPVHERKGSPYVKGLHEESLGSPKEVMKCIEKGKKNRHTGKTNMNEHSSRSHSVVQLKVEQSTQKGKSNSLLFLVDLAGSEKVAKTGATGDRLNEAKNINKSLSCLGNVINALTEKKKTHVPYRDSKLTRILQESLGCNARMTMVICCSPAKMNEQETHSTLMFGQRVKTIKNNVKANTEKSSEYWMKMYNNECNKGAKVKKLVLKLIKEAKEHRKGKKRFNPFQKTVSNKMSFGFHIIYHQSPDIKSFNNARRILLRFPALTSIHVTKVKCFVNLEFSGIKIYSGGKPKPEVDLEELKKLLDDFGKGDAHAKIEKMDGDDDGNSPDTPAGQKNKDSERLGSKLSKTSAAKGSKAGKGKSKGGKGSKLSGVEEGDEDGEGGADGEGEGDKSADGGKSEDGEEGGEGGEGEDGEGGDGGGGKSEVPEDVKAVLEQEVKLKTEEYEQERNKMVKEIDAKDDKIAKLTQELKTLKAQMEQHGNKYKSAQQDGRKAMEQVTELNRAVDQYKERARRLEQESKNHEGEVENAKQLVKQKEEESRSKDKAIEEAKEEAQQVKAEMENVRQSMQTLSTKYGQQLCVLAEDISMVGKNFVGEQNVAQFEYRKPDPSRPNEGFAASRALLAKAKHYAVGGGRKHRELEEELRRMRNDKEQREAAQMEQVMMLSQAKQQMDQMKEAMQDLKDDNARLQSNMQKRNAQIAAMGKTGADDIDDPDLKMLNDEHQGQIGKMRVQLQEESRKAERANRARDDVMQQVERLKSEMQAQKEKFLREKAELEAGNSVLQGYENDMKEFEKNPQNTLTAPVGEGETDIGPTAKKHIKTLEGQLEQANSRNKSLEEENQQLRSQVRNLNGEVSVAKKSADVADSKFRKATEEHLKERASLRNSIDQATKTKLMSSKGRGSIKQTTTAGSLKRSGALSDDDDDEDSSSSDDSKLSSHLSK
ncbi:kinesin-1 heavy chain-like [Symsagittifera roscoffensis]|uniref:kinesin-1 heavy chain-like n=1 Tax=Symsagittifera roscoffensis TaxID=84072 RepID=UPI00307C6F25